MSVLQKFLVAQASRLCCEQSIYKVFTKYFLSHRRDAGATTDDVCSTTDDVCATTLGFRNCLSFLMLHLADGLGVRD